MSILRGAGIPSMSVNAMDTEGLDRIDGMSGSQFHRWKKKAAYSGENLSMGKLPFTLRNVLICGLEHYSAFHHSIIFQCSRNTTACLIAKGTRSLSTFEWFIESQAKMHIHLNWKHFHYNILHFNLNSLFFSNMTTCCNFQIPQPNSLLGNIKGSQKYSGHLMTKTQKNI